MDYLQARQHRLNRVPSGSAGSLDKENLEDDASSCIEVSIMSPKHQMEMHTGILTLGVLEHDNCYYCRHVLNLVLEGRVKLYRHFS